LAQPCEACQGLGYTHVKGDETARLGVCGCVESCPKCQGSRYLVVEEQGYSAARPCECLAAFERVQRFNGAGIPMGYGQKSLPSYQNLGGNQSKLKMQLLHYQKHFDPKTAKGVLLMGAPGTGKTHLACALVNYLTLERGVACRFVDFFHLTGRIRATYDGRAAESEQDILRGLVDVPVLVIDELGKGLGTTWELGIVDQLISRRYNAGRVVVATSNYLPESMLEGGPADRSESLEERVGRRIFSRLAEMCDLLPIKGPDFRGQALASR
jgi:DNA replication protein DnaC